MCHVARAATCITAQQDRWCAPDLFMGTPLSENQHFQRHALALSLCLFGEWSYHLSSFLPMRYPAAVTIRVAIGYQVITKSTLSSVQFAA